MLAVQVQYWTLQETIRHDRAQENYWTASLAETVRHNQVQENYWFASLEEQSRHNAEQEAIGWANVDVGIMQANASVLASKAKVYTAQLSAKMQHETNTIRVAELKQQQKEFKWQKTYDKRKFNLDVMKEQAKVAEWATDGITNILNKTGSLFKK